MTTQYRVVWYYKSERCESPVQSHRAAAFKLAALLRRSSPGDHISGVIVEARTISEWATAS